MSEYEEESDCAETEESSGDESQLLSRLMEKFESENPELL